MNNKQIISGGEINLTELFKVIWNGKIKIALITLIIFLIISVNNKYKPKQPDSFKNSLVINPAKGKEFLSFLPVYSYLNENHSYLNENRPNKIEQIGRLDILEKFIMEAVASAINGLRSGEVQSENEVLIKIKILTSRVLG